MGNNCPATVTVVRGHSRPDQIIPLQAVNGNGNTNSISVGKEEEEEDDDDDDDDDDDEDEDDEEEICKGCICAGCKCCKCCKKMFICLIPLLC